jgi:UDP-N-acetylmuramate dehydrogenase
MGSYFTKALSRISIVGKYMSDIFSKLPTVSGRYIQQADLSKTVWFRVGGAADILFKPKNLDDLQNFLQSTTQAIPITIIGAGSNLLIRDGGVSGVVIKLTRGFAEIIIEDLEIEVGGGALDRTVALACEQAGIGGLEFLVGIPGTIGGAVKMNAGAYGGEVKDYLVWAECVDRNGDVSRKTADELGFAYRKSNIDDNVIITKARFRGIKREPSIILANLQKNLKDREDSQPVKGRTGGSTFKNPPNQKAWELIDQAGCRGMKLGGAQVSEKHCNFFLNLGNATAADIETLGEQVRELVKKNIGIDLEWEIKRIGSADNKPSTYNNKEASNG